MELAGHLGGIVHDDDAVHRDRLGGGYPSALTARHRMPSPWGDRQEPVPRAARRRRPSSSPSRRRIDHLKRISVRCEGTKACQPTMVPTSHGLEPPGNPERFMQEYVLTKDLLSPRISLLGLRQVD
jgi:hypothetical protein